MNSLRPVLLSLFLLPCLGLAAAAQDAPEAASEASFDFTPGGPITDAELGEYYVEMECSVAGESVGTMTISFWPETAPITVRNFLRYCASGFYDGKSFHRIMRTFMVQGGDPMGNGMGNGPNGNIKGEFSTAPEYEHHYGVISMARGPSPDSASCQFFICCDESGAVWNLDGSYAAFGKLVHGVSTLEAIADVAVSGAEQSTPTKKVIIVKAEVKKGTPEVSEEITRPAPQVDLGGEPPFVRVQHVLISFKGTPTTATRTKEEAETLAAEVLKRAQDGEDFTALVLELSDDPSQPDDPNPGVYRIANNGITDSAGERKQFEIQKRMRDLQQELMDKVQAGEIDQAELQNQLMAERDRLLPEYKAAAAFPRAGMAKAFSDVSFGLEVGEIGMAAFKEGESPFGWHIIKRIE